MRQLLILCDGTNNSLTGTEADTHVVTLAELLGADPDPERILYYDPGVGNPGEIPGTTLWDKARRRYERIEGLAFGRGVYDNIAEGYRFLMHRWRGPDDQIWLFGFSRGAFTARSIGGLVNRFGILEPHLDSLLPTLLHLYFAEPSARVNAISAQVSRLFASTERPSIHFVGVWDTVATVGTWPFNLRFHVRPDLAGKRFVHVRQALALDEHRAQFVPRAYAQDNGPYRTADGEEGAVVQLWFRGAHCDVGGGADPSSGVIARAPLAWLVTEAVGCGLRLHHQGQPLDREERTAAAVSQTIARLSKGPDPVAAGTARRVINDELRRMPIWALTGLALRDTRRVTIDGGPDVSTHMAEHPSVAEWAARYPRDTVWRTPGPGLRFWVHLGLIPCWLLVLGQLLHGLPAGVEGAWASFTQVFQDAGTYLSENLRFQRWQLAALFLTDGTWWSEAQRFHAPRWALVWDLALILSYAYVLACLASRAFTHAAGLNRLGRPVPTALRVLGWALPLAVFADLGENLASWATISLGHAELWLLASVGRAAILICTLGKLTGLLGVAALVLGQGLLGPQSDAGRAS